MTLKGGTSQACAACKYQRRRCLPECQLAPYFPADQPKKFQNAHRLFGVSNILKILKEVDLTMRPEAMKSIIYESNVRDKSPTSGCYGYIYDLEYSVRSVEEELHMVRSQIGMCKMQQCHNVKNDNGQVVIVNQDDYEDTTSMLHFGIGHSNKMITNDQNVNEITMFSDDGLVENDQFWGNEGYSSAENNQMEYQLDDQLKMQKHFNSWQYQQHDQIQMENMMNNNKWVHHFEGVHTFLDDIDDRQSFIDSKAVHGYESNGSDSTGSMKALESSDVQNAAARYSLTNII